MLTPSQRAQILGRLPLGSLLRCQSGIKKALGCPLFVLRILTGSKLQVFVAILKLKKKIKVKKCKPLIMQEQRGFSQKWPHNRYDSFPKAQREQSRESLV